MKRWIRGCAISLSLLAFAACGNAGDVPSEQDAGEAVESDSVSPSMDAPADVPSNNSPPPACPGPVDFETDGNGSALLPGMPVTALPAWGIDSVLCTNNNPNHPNNCIIFDSANPSAGDFVLGTPNVGFGGPGIGTGGEPGELGQNDTAQNNLLVIAENLHDCEPDGLVDFPLSEPSGGTIVLNLSEPSTVASITVVNTQGTVNVVVDGGGSMSFPFQILGDNSLQTVPIGVSGVVTLEIDFTGSGGLDDVEICPDPEPTSGCPLPLPPVAGTTYFVRQDGDDSNSGLSDSPSEAWQTLAHAAGSVSVGDLVLVGPGLYNECGLSVPAGARFRAAGGPSVTEVFCSNFIVMFTQDESVLEGFTLRNGCTGSSICQVVNANGGENATIQCNVIRGAGYSGVQTATRPVTIRRNTFYSNTFAVLGQNGDGDTIVVEDNIFLENGDGIRSFNADQTIVNSHNLFWGNSNFNYIVFGSSSHLLTNPIVADPLLTNPAADDFTLQLGSPAIGAASDTGDIGAFASN